MLAIHFAAIAFMPSCTSPHGYARCSVRLCADAADDPMDAAAMSGLYASLQKRRTLLSSRRSAVGQEKALLSDLARQSQSTERTQGKMWEHWFGEEGDEASESLRAAEGDEEALTKLMDEFPDWAEPANRLATAKYLDGEFEESAQLCLRVLRIKPWHFGASSGIVMCYAKLAGEANVVRKAGLIEEANRWAGEAMPQPGPQREAWVERMLGLMDARLAELEAIAEPADADGE